MAGDAAASTSRAPTSRSTATFSTTRRWCWAPSAARTGSTTPATASIGNGDLADQLREAIRRLPEGMRFQPAASASRRQKPGTPPSRPPPPERHITEGSFFVGDDRTIHQMTDGAGRPRHLRRHAAQSRRHDDRQAACRPDRPARPRPPRPPVAERGLARGEPQRRPPRPEPRLRPVRQPAYGPINKTTFSRDRPTARSIRRMPNLVKFREDPDAMLVMSLEDYDEVTGKAAKAAIMHKDVVGRTPPVTSVASAEEGLLVSLDRKGTVDLPFIATLYGKPEERVIAELGDLIYHDPETQDLADRRRLSLRQRPRRSWPRPRKPGRTMPATPRPCGRAARGRAARRHRRQSGRAVDTGSRHPGVRRRSVRRSRRRRSRSAI